MNDTSPFHQHRDGTVIDILVQPRASTSVVAGVHDGALRIRIAAPPVDGAANDAVVELISKLLKVRKGDVEIVSGVSSRRKRVLVRGLGIQSIRAGLVQI